MIFIESCAFGELKSVFNRFHFEDRLKMAEKGIFPKPENISESLLARNWQKPPIGFLFANCWPDDPETLVVTLGTLPQFRRQGAARALMERLQELNPKKSVVWRCDKDNFESASLARSLGGVLEGEDGRHYKFRIGPVLKTLP